MTYSNKEIAEFVDLFGEPRISRNVVTLLRDPSAFRDLYRSCVRRIAFAVRWHPLFNGPAVMGDAQARIVGTLPELTGLVSLHVDRSRPPPGPDPSFSILETAAQKCPSLRALTVIELRGVAPLLARCLSTWNSLECLHLGSSDFVDSDFPWATLLPASLRHLRIEGSLLRGSQLDLVPLSLLKELDSLHIEGRPRLDYARVRTLLSSLVKIRHLHLCDLWKDPSDPNSPTSESGDSPMTPVSPSSEEDPSTWPTWLPTTKLVTLSISRSRNVRTSPAAFVDLLQRNSQLTCLSFRSIVGEPQLFYALASSVPTSLRSLYLHSAVPDPAFSETLSRVPQLTHLGISMLIDFSDPGSAAATTNNSDGSATRFAARFEAIGKLSRLRSLEIVGFDPREHLESLKATLEKLKVLEELTVETWGGTHRSAQGWSDDLARPGLELRVRTS